MSTEDKAPRRFDLERARQIAKEYAEPRLMIDNRTECDELNESAMEMDAKYWAEFNRHEQTKAELIREKKKVERLREQRDFYIRSHGPEAISVMRPQAEFELEAIDKESEGAG